MHIKSLSIELGITPKNDIARQSVQIVGGIPLHRRDTVVDTLSTTKVPQIYSFRHPHRAPGFVITAKWFFFFDPHTPVLHAVQ